LLEYILTGTTLAIMVAVFVEHEKILRVVRRRPLPPALDHYPSVTVIRPIRGLDCEVEKNIQAGLDTGYPGHVDTIFVFDDESEPALPIVEKVLTARTMEGHRDRTQIVICGQPPANRTGKLNAMLAGMERATGELIAFADSDIRSDMDTLRIMVEKLLTTENAGSAFPWAIVTSKPRTAGDVGIVAMLNSLYIPMASILYAKRDENLPFILGQYMVFERETLDEVIALDEMKGQLTDDLHMGSLVNAGGLKNVIAPCSVGIIQHGVGPRDAFDQYVRWMHYSRSGMRDWSYKIPSFVRAGLYLTGLALGTVALAKGFWGAAALGLGASLMVNYTMIKIHNRVGGGRISPQHWLIPGLFFILFPLVLLRVYTQKHLEWRGRTYALNSEANLGEESEVGAKTRQAAA
jgi:ceramide glucosyltransferase